MYLTDQLDPVVRERVLAGYEEARTRPVTLRANTLKATTGDVERALTQAGIAFERVPWYTGALVLTEACERDVWALDIYRDGCVYLQSLSSMLPPLALEPRAGADILDMCAAPGGKTSQIAALTGNAAHLTACEMSAPRAEKLEYNLGKLDVDNVNVMRTDARRLDEFFRFDQILLDAPCTGTGTVRGGDEKAARRITRELLAKVTRSQRALLDRALTVLKPGGTLVYSTCSVLPEENENQVRAALKKHRDCRIAPLVSRLEDEGTASTDSDDTATGRSKQAMHGDRAESPVVLPHLDEGTFAVPMIENGLPGTLSVAPTRYFEGFFIAVIRKTEGGRTR